MKKRDTVLLIITLLLVAGLVIREIHNNRIKEQLEALERDVAIKEEVAVEERNLYLDRDRKASEEIRFLQQKIENIRADREKIVERYKKLKGSFKKVEELKNSSKSELFSEIRKYKLALKGAEESILQLTFENSELQKENLLWKSRFESAEEEILRQQEQYLVLKENFKKAVKLGKKSRGNLAGKLVVFAAGLVVGKLIK